MEEWMTVENHLRRTVKEMQRLLETLVAEKGSFTDPEVIRVSQTLDVYIVALQRMVMYKEEQSLPA